MPSKRQSIPKIVASSTPRSGLRDEKRLEIVKEIGDVLWYCATLARDLGYELDDVAQMNVDKLRSRMQRHIISGSGDNR